MKPGRVRPVRGPESNRMRNMMFRDVAGSRGWCWCASRMDEAGAGRAEPRWRGPESNRRHPVFQKVKSSERKLTRSRANAKRRWWSFPVIPCGFVCLRATAAPAITQSPFVAARIRRRFPHVASAISVRLRARAVNRQLRRASGLRGPPTEHRPRLGSPVHPAARRRTGMTRSATRGLLGQKTGW